MLTGLIYLFHGDPSFTYPIPFCIPAHLPTGILSIIFIIRFFFVPSGDFGSLHLTVTPVPAVVVFLRLVKKGMTLYFNET
jgi:hypothetical protein